MAERDPLRSGAIFRIQSQEYAALRSPVPRVTSGGPSLARPVPVHGSTVGQALMHPSPTEAGIMFQPFPTGVARGSVAGHAQQLGAPRIDEDAFGTSGELRRGTKSLSTLVVSHPAASWRKDGRVSRFEVGGPSNATMDSCGHASVSPDTLRTTARNAFETPRGQRFPSSAHNQEGIVGAASDAAVNIRLDPSDMRESVAMGIDSIMNTAGDITIGSNMGGRSSPEETTFNGCSEKRNRPKQRQHLKRNPKQVNITLEPDQSLRQQRDVKGWEPIAGRTLRAKRGNQTEKANNSPSSPRGEAPALRTKAWGAGEDCQADPLPPCSGVRVSEETVLRKRRRASAATLKVVRVRRADDVGDLVTAPASSRRYLAPCTKVEVTTTRSGRRSIPVVDFSQTKYCEGNKAKVALSAPQKDARVSDKRARPTLADAKPFSNPSSAKPAACGTSMPRKPRTIAAAAAEVGLADGTPDTAIDAVGKPEASTGIVKTTRSGRRSAPVLDWWRSQRLSHAPDGNVVVASGPSKDELFGGRLMAPSRLVKTNSSGAKARSPRSKAVKRDRDGAPSREETSWTQSQLSSLRVAQMGTAPRAKDFWGVVARKVEGRDPQACQQKWFEHFASPRAQRRKVGTKSTRVQKTGTPVAVKTPTISEGALKAAGFPATQAEQPSKQDDADDLFQATPMRGRFGVQPRGNFFGEAPPRTPAGPVAPVDEDASTASRSPRNEHSVLKPVRTTYVQAMSKKMRKASGALNVGMTNSMIQGKVNNSRQHRSRPAGRKVHAVTTSRGRSLKASVCSSGAVNITSTGGSDDEDELGESDGSDSEG